MRKLLFLICLIFASCNIPQIEDAKCTASRETVRSFFSQHLAEENAGGFTVESVARKSKFLTPEFHELLQKNTDMEKPFIAIDPTGFKVGECKVSGESNVMHTVRMFAKVDNKPIETEMKIAVEKRGDQWMISDLLNDKNESLVKELNTTIR